MDLQKNLAAMHAHGDYEVAAKFLDDPKTVATYEADKRGGKDTTLWQLERGAVALAMDDPDRCIAMLNRAEERTRYNYERGTGEILSTWVLNDSAPEFLASPYEDQYVNVFKVLSYLELGQIEGKATAEARRIADKARYLRQYMGKFVRAVNEETRKRFSQDERNAKIDDPRLRQYASESAAPGGGVEFVESPLGAYLSAIAFLKTPGEGEAQRGAATRLLDAIHQQGSLIGSVKSEPFESLGDARPDSVNTLAVAFSGRGPTKGKDKFGPVFLWYTSFYLVLPRLEPHPSAVTGAKLETSDGTSYDLNLVEDMSRVACANFDRQMPGIYSKTMLRVFTKAAAVGVATVATDVGTRRDRRGEAAAAQLAVRALGFLYIWLSEDADTRGWVFLPGQAWVGHFKLPEGERNVRIVYSTRSGSTIAGPWKRVVVTPTGLSTVVAHTPN